MPELSTLGGGVAVTPAFADNLLLNQGGNSRFTTFSLLQGLLDGQASRKLVDRGAEGGLIVNAAKFSPNLSGASVNVVGALPNRSIVFATTTFISSALTGTLTSIDVGYTGVLNAFGATIGITIGASNIGAIGPIPLYGNTNIIVTANGGTGDTANAGKISLVAYYLSFATPTA